MSLALYDRAIVEKLNRWTAKSNIHVYAPDETERLFQTIADETKDKNIELPIICISRNSSFTITNVNKKPTTYNGMVLDKDEDANILTQLDMIPINISYQVDVITRYREEADTYCRDLIFNFINHPTITIVIPYNGVNRHHNATIRINDTVQDSSGISQRLSPGQFYRMTMGIYVDDAYLWSVPKKEMFKIYEPGLRIYTSESDIVTEKIDV